MTYKIIRTFYRNGREAFVKGGLTLVEAARECKSHEANSRTARSKQARERTRRHGPWADHYEIETPGRS